MTFTVDLQAVEIPVVLRNYPTGFDTVPLGAGWTMSATGDDTFDRASEHTTFSGQLTAPGSASGTLRVDLTVNTDAGPVHASSGDVTWTAS